LSAARYDRVQVDIQQITAELLTLPLDEFTAKRNARAKELKAAGQRELASQVSQLKKPPVYLWAANQVARRDPDLLRSIEHAAASVSKAQTAGGTTARDLRTASEAFQKALEEAGQAAMAVLEQGHHAATEETLRRIREIFRGAALHGDETWDALRQGALISEPEAGDDVLAMFQAGAPPSPALRDKGGGAARRARDREGKTAGEPAQDPHEARALERAARMAAERAEQLQDVAKRLRAEADQAAEQARRTDERAKAAEEQAADARKEAAKAARALGRQRT
jgi:hypothetical protein